jgi:hypothetical protein
MLKGLIRTNCAHLLPKTIPVTITQSEVINFMLSVRAQLLNAAIESL